MNRLSVPDRAKIVAAIVEGSSMRATSRMTGFAINTIMKLVVDLGRACMKFHGETVVNVPAKRIQCDEIWSFVGAKEKNADPAKKATGEAGDVWTWTGMDPDSKLMVSWLVGGRDSGSAFAFVEDLAYRLAMRAQVTTDGNRLYVTAIEGAFGMDVDYAQVVKLYGSPAEGERTYSPAQCIGCRKTALMGNPDPKHISTSIVERQNLTLRMSSRRFTRLTNGFSKKLENHAAAVALHYVHYNFARIHKTLRVTPAMQAGLTDHVWTIEEIVRLLG